MLGLTKWLQPDNPTWSLGWIRDFSTWVVWDGLKYTSNPTQILPVYTLSKTSRCPLWFPLKFWWIWGKSLLFLSSASILCILISVKRFIWVTFCFFWGDGILERELCQPYPFLFIEVLNKFPVALISWDTFEI